MILSYVWEVTQEVNPYTSCQGYPVRIPKLYLADSLEDLATKLDRTPYSKITKLGQVEVPQTIHPIDQEIR